ncbi:MAG: methyltransferase [Bacteroidetes bacterium]|nr:methyltransferase [Bacteroidota bacterium]
MPNPYFQFKQFVIYQDQCAMKVSTDSCLFGAWISKRIIPGLSNIRTVLDIGVGTGLLMLMMAQEHNFEIDGIDLDISAFQQASSNISLTKWKERLQLYQGDVKAFTFNRPYDLIISNPPFYENNLLPHSESKAAAMHDATLTFEALLASIEKWLAPEGYAALLIPYHRFEYLKNISQVKGFYIRQAVNIQHRSDHRAIRTMVLLSRAPAELSIRNMVIKENTGQYSDAFMELLSGYYL